VNVTRREWIVVAIESRETCAGSATMVSSIFGVGSSDCADAMTALVVACIPAIAQTIPAGYPADYAQTIAAANKEGKVVIYSALDTKAAQPLVKDFNALYPNIKVEYNDMNSPEMYNRFIAEVASGQGSADVMWSSAMDLQVKLVDDGHAMTYASPEVSKLPTWAVYKNQAYGTTYEPAVFIYNKRLVTGDEIPQDHAAFAKVINGKVDKFKGKVTTYDIEKSGVGFMLITQDSKFNPQFWDMVKALGVVGPRVQSSAGTMMERISSGENLAAAKAYQKETPTHTPPNKPHPPSGVYVIASRGDVRIPASVQKSRALNLRMIFRAVWSEATPKMTGKTRSDVTSVCAFPSRSIVR